MSDLTFIDMSSLVAKDSNHPSHRRGMRGQRAGERMWMKTQFKNKGGRNLEAAAGLEQLHFNEQMSDIEYTELAPVESSWTRVEEALWLCIKTREPRDAYGRYHPRAKIQTNLGMLGATFGDKDLYRKTRVVDDNGTVETVYMNAAGKTIDYEAILEAEGLGEVTYFDIEDLDLSDFEVK